MGEVFGLQSCVKFLCDQLICSVLWVKVMGVLFGAQPSPSVPPWNGVLCVAVFVVPPTAHWYVEVKAAAFTPKLLYTR